MDIIKAFFEGCRLGRKQTCRNLTVFPLLGPFDLSLDYIVLEAALAEGLIEIRELDAAGSVPELRLINRGERAVLIVEGEELVGAKQNRVVNTTILVAAGTGLVIPVSCVEQGRWHYRSESFSSGDKMMHFSLRRAAQDSVRYSLAQGAGYRSDQGRVWDAVAEMADKLDVESPTMAAAEVFEHCDDRLSSYVDGFVPVDRQVGALFAIDGVVLGLEAFGSPDTFGRFFAKLVKSYALDAIGGGSTPETDKRAPTDRARRFLASAAGAKSEAHRSVGLGETISIDSRILSGAALTHEDRVLHVSAFRKAAGGGACERVGYQSFSRRRQRLFE